MKIIITKSSKKAMKKMDKATRNRMIAAVNGIPAGDIKRLRGYEDNFRLRVGDYRILYTQISEKIIINNILPRGEAYKRL